jgi:hypothetical protein
MKGGVKERFLFVAARPAPTPLAAGSSSFSPFGGMKAYRTLDRRGEQGKNSKLL